MFWVGSLGQLGCGGLPASEEAGSASLQSQGLTNGGALSAGQFSDTAVMTRANNNSTFCTATLLTNRWALTASHCLSLPSTQMLVTYNTLCTINSQCAGRGAICTPAGFCGAIVAQSFVAPGSPTGQQVTLLQLATPIYAVSTAQDYSISQPVYSGTKASLQNKNITVLGGGTTLPTITMGTFNITGTSTTWSYVMNGLNGVSAGPGDSGGPGYFGFDGLNQLSGVTVTANSQHDLPEAFQWLNDTLYSSPQLFKPSEGTSVALSATGAYAVTKQGSTVGAYTCSAEPCNPTNWTTTSQTVWSDATSPPAIARESGGFTVFGQRAGSNGYHFRTNTSGSFGSDTFLGGACASPPAVSTRPGSGSPILDLLCIDTNLFLYINQRVSGNWSDWGFLGAPPGGILAGTKPAVVSTDSNTVYVFVVGNSVGGSIWMRKGVGGIGWSSWTSLAGGNVRSVAAASYDSQRVDVFVTTADGTLFQKTLQNNTWWTNWEVITRGGWPDGQVWAAAYPGHKGRLTVGAHQGGWTFMQRYSQW